MAAKVIVRRVGGGYQASQLRGNTSVTGRSSRTAIGARANLANSTRGGIRGGGPGGGQ